MYLPHRKYDGLLDNAEGVVAMQYMLHEETVKHTGLIAGMTGFKP